MAEEDVVGKQGFELDVVEDVVVAASRDAAHAATEQLVAGVDSQDADEEDAIPVRSPENDTEQDSDGALW